MTLQDRVRQLVELHGGLRAAELFTDLDAGYLRRLLDGEKINPKKYVLDRLGVRRVITYELLKD
jgi:hypothetical protein